MTIQQQTKEDIEKHRIAGWCRDCDRYKAFCEGRRYWFEENGEKYWVCRDCLADRPDTLYAYMGDDR